MTPAERILPVDDGQQSKASDASPDSGAERRARVMFTYWGRRGAMTQFAMELSQAAMREPSVSPTLSVSRQNENYAGFAASGASLFPVDTFETGAGALLHAWRIPLLRRRLLHRIRQERIEAVVELMPHLWSPAVMPVVRAAGARYCTIAHDAQAHPGDRTGWAQPLLDHAVRSADIVFTLSSAVTQRIVAAGPARADTIHTLFHPDFHYGRRPDRRTRAPGEALRLLFLGRILPYKGLPLFIDTAERLRQEGLEVEIGVFGEGNIGESAGRLQRMRAEVVNRWLTEDEIAAVLQRYDAIVLSHVEASQSGVAAAAFGSGLPVIATPVGGLQEQVQDGVTGALASGVDAGALAEAAKRLLLDPAMYAATCRNIGERAEQRSMARFVREIVRLSTT
jgi:glycosyltransferase involved in cell wall biosynthesis